MKLIKEVSPIEIKRTFVIADHIAHVHKGKKLGNNRKFLKDVSEKEFEKRLADIKRKILKLKEKNLDKLVCPEWPKRLKAYNGSKWYLAEAGIKELGVWSKAGGLPLKWTSGSLFETAEHVRKGLENKSKLIKRRPRHSIPNILKIKSHMEQTEKYLYPIVFKANTGTMGRKKFKRKMKGDIDDGCMRSIALAMSKRNPITIYFGIPDKKI